jgi:tetratricopeptide (TPR) repeat protein
VRLLIGPLHLEAEVVHLEPNRGAGLQVLDLVGEKRAALQRFVEGATSTIVIERHGPAGPPLGKVLAAARRLFVGLEEGDPFGAVGLPPTAGLDEIQERIQGLTRLFTAPRSDASPPQQARLEQAARAVARVEAALKARASALRQEAALSNTEQPRARADVRRLYEEAVEAEGRGDKDTARKALQRALVLAPDDAEVKHRLSALTSAADQKKALELLAQAHVFVSGVGMRRQGLEAARQAVKLSTTREIRLKAAEVLARCGELDDAAALAQLVHDEDPNDQLALRALLALHEKTRQWTAAVRAGEALMRLNRGDDVLRKRVQQLAEQVRKERG